MPKKMQFQRIVFEIIRDIDRNAIMGKNIAGCIDVPTPLFSADPKSHQGDVCDYLQSYLRSLTRGARKRGVLGNDEPLIRRFHLTYDIFSPRLQRFIEVDERQHFSQLRLRRLWQLRRVGRPPLYAAYFWMTVFPRLRTWPAADQHPPYRDEQRAYLDEARDLLPIRYGLQPSLRLDEHTIAYKIAQSGAALADLIRQICGRRQ